MVPKSKVVKACKAMKVMGIPKETVKPVLEQLLEVYDDNWKLIEEENYRVLTDAIFDNDFPKREDTRKDQSLSEYETEECERPLKRRARLRNQSASPSKCSRDLGKPLLRTQEKADGSQTCSKQNMAACHHLCRKDTKPEIVTVSSPDSSPEPCIGKGKKPSSPQCSLSGQEIRPDTSLVNSKHLSSPTGVSAGGKVYLSPHIQFVRKRKRPNTAGGTCFFPYEEQETILSKDLSPNECEPDEQHKNAIIAISDSHADVLPQFEVPLAIIHPVPPNLVLEDGSPNGSSSNSKEDDLESLEMKYPDAEFVVPPALLWKDGSSSDFPSDPEGKGIEILKSKHLHKEDERERASDSVQFDIASLPERDVKVSLICNSRDLTDLHVPDLDKIFKRVEEQYLKTYRIIEPGFSVVKLMKDVCECFLEEGTNFSDDGQVRSIKLTPTLEITKKNSVLDALHGRVQQGDFCISSCFPYESVRFRNLIEVLPHIPKILNSNSLSMYWNTSGGRDKKTIALERLESLSTNSLVRSSNTNSLVGSSNANILVGSSNRNSLVGSSGMNILVGSSNMNSLVGSSNTNCLEGSSYTNSLVGSSNTNCLVVVQKQSSSCDLLKAPHYVDDITRGAENVKVSLVNDFIEERLPVFHYIPRNIPYQNAHAKFLLARISDDNCCSNCTGDCLSMPIPCACAAETGGEFAYKPGGLLEEKFLQNYISMNSDPEEHHLFYCKDCPLERSRNKKLSGKCKGHLLRKFIKECWYKCGCSLKCGNRVVQRGITVNLQVFMTPQSKGWGLRTLEDLPRGAFICEYVGEIVTNSELFDRNAQQNEREQHTYPVLLDADWGSEGVLKDEEALCLDATNYGNVARFINHRCFDSNLVEIPVEVETPDHHYYHVAFFTTRKVDALEELTWDYGIDFKDHRHPVKAFRCRCGSNFCRDEPSTWN